MYVTQDMKSALCVVGKPKPSTYSIWNQLHTNFYIFKGVQIVMLLSYPEQKSSHFSKA